MDGGGGIQESLRAERKGFWDWHPNWGVNLPQTLMARAAPWTPALPTRSLGFWGLCLLHGSLIPSGF